MRYVLLALLLFAVGVTVAMLERDTQAFTPIVRVRSIDGLYITLVQPRTAKRSACAAVVERFEQALAQTCATCTIESTDCATRLEGIDQALAAGEGVPVFTVSAQGMRVGLLGPPPSVKAECEAMASQFVRSGVKASCVSPRT
jgi:hypothetical protein